MDFREVHVLNEGPKVQDTQIGDIIRVLEGEEDGEKAYVSYKVTAVYKYQVLAKADRGRKKRFFSFGDLVILGKESQCSDTLGKRILESGRYGARHTYNRTAQ